MITQMIDDVKGTLRRMALDGERILSAHRVGQMELPLQERSVADILSFVQEMTDELTLLFLCRRPEERRSGGAPELLELEGRVKEVRNDLLRFASLHHAMER